MNEQIHVLNEQVRQESQFVARVSEEIGRVIVGQRYNPLAPSLRRFYYFIAFYILWILVCALMSDTVSRSLFIMKKNSAAVA